MSLSIHLSPDVRVTHCDGCKRTVTLIGRGDELGDYQWFCPYLDGLCSTADTPRLASQLRGPLENTIPGLPPLAEKPSEPN